MKSEKVKLMPLDEANQQTSGEIEIHTSLVPKKSEELSIYQSMKDLARLAALPLVGFLMLPLWTVVNTAICGFFEDTDILAGYGLGTLYLATFGISPMLQLSSLQTVIGQANGARNYRLARIYLHRQYLITALVALVSLVPLL